MTVELPSHSYRVRRWSAFVWSPASDVFANAIDGRPVRPLDPEARAKVKADNEVTLRRQREDGLQRAATIMEHKLLDICPRYEPTVKQVRIEGQPQLLFELTVRADTEDEACEIAGYRIGRALSVKVPTGRRKERARLAVPWGEWEVEQQTDGSLRVAS